HGILVPNGHTRPEETVRADHVAPDLLTAVRAARPVLSQLLQVGPRLYQVCFGGNPLDRKRERVVEAAYLRLGLPLLAHTLGKFVGYVLQRGRGRSARAGSDHGDHCGG
ncbi:hypothetical protein AB0K55_39370, partial [Streptomyces massasporeus]